jgi:gamma-glutamyl-gamma-aminobutyrate hydrolase PuuD
MKKILISQRRDPVDNRDEVRDGMDVRFASLFYEMGFLPIPLCSELYNAEGYIEALKPDAILISGGNDIGEQPKRDMLETRLLDYAKDQNIPVFGICRGTQIINHYLGGTTRQVKGHVATNHVLVGDWAKRKGYSKVNSYHNFSITKDSIAKDLDALTFTEDGVVEAIKHKELPWMGIMWHPEREPSLVENDKKLIFEHLNKECKKIQKND